MGIAILEGKVCAHFSVFGTVAELEFLNHLVLVLVQLLS
jgi:hypothetical protein